jgi:hypothetical protein
VIWGGLRSVDGLIPSLFTFLEQKILRQEASAVQGCHSEAYVASERARLLPYGAYSPSCNLLSLRLSWTLFACMCRSMASKSSLEPSLSASPASASMCNYGNPH